MNVLSVENVSVRSPGRMLDQSSVHHLVNEASFSLKMGEIASIIGPNGAGKSTLVKAISGELEYEGNITFFDIPASHPQRAKQLSILPQSSSLSFPFRVKEVVELSRIPHKTGIKTDTVLIEHALDMMDITYLSDRLYTDLSGGEKQRVQLARVFCQLMEQTQSSEFSVKEGYPKILILDEPNTSLDLAHQHILMQAIKKVSEQGVSVLMVSHDINLAARYSDKMLAMVCSEQVIFDIPERVVREDTMRALFGPHVSIVNIQGSEANDTGNLPLVIGA